MGAVSRGREGSGGGGPFSEVDFQLVLLRRMPIISRSSDAASDRHGVRHEVAAEFTRGLLQRVAVSGGRP